MNRWSWLGSSMLLIGSVAHFVIVDLSVWILEARYVRWLPDSLLSQMKSTVIDWGYLGTNSVLRVFAGYSLWVVFSLFTIGLYNMLIFKQLPQGHKLRLQSLILGISASTIFLVLAAVCFIYPAAIGGALAVVFFGLGIRKERANNGI